jgi:signal transduction histidine kinase
MIGDDREERSVGMGRDTGDSAVQALVELRAGLERTIADLTAAAARADELIERRKAGASWLDIVTKEERPLVIETITRVLDDLGELGSRFRREEALALQRENVSITRISELFRVSRQRVSTILHGTRSRAEA